MKIIVTGGRDFAKYERLEEVLDHYLSRKDKAEIELIAGRCDRGKLTYLARDGSSVYGADGLGERYADLNNIKFTPFPADWSLGILAGPKRNAEMAFYCDPGDATVAFWDGASRGTGDMINKARERGLIVKVIKY
jgi:hypothetical protein